jgi:hypothetical protein
MAIGVNDIQFYYSTGSASGGSVASTANASLGGQISTSRVVAQTASAPVVVTGVTILWAINNAEGNGTLTYSSTLQQLSWKPPGALNTYYSSTLTGNTTITLGDTDGQVVLQVVFASLPASFKQDTITITNSLNNVFGSVSAADSLVGKVVYRCLFVKNAHATDTASGVKLFISQLTTGPDEIDVGLDPAVVGNGVSTGVAAVIGNESTAPAGVTFSRPVTSTAGLSIGTLLAGQVKAFWERRTVDPNTTGNVTMNSSKIAVALTA